MHVHLRFCLRILNVVTFLKRAGESLQRELIKYDIDSKRDITTCEYNTSKPRLRH